MSGLCLCSATPRFKNALDYNKCFTVKKKSPRSVPGLLRNYVADVPSGLKVASGHFVAAEFAVSREARPSGRIVFRLVFAPVSECEAEPAI
jgi:hypothetical protein